MELEIKTVTPLWTGGVEGKVDRIHETGILGSLRWWYEAIVRGLGGKACDPTTSSCTYNPDERNNGLCDVCQVFGATGWGRRFRLEVVNDQTQPLWHGDRALNIRPPNRNRGWFLLPGRMGTFTLRLIGDQESLARIAALLRFVERWGSLGARPQLGYGVITIQNQDTIEQLMRGFSWRSVVSSPVSNTSDSLPNLQQFGFFRYRFQPADAAWWSRIGGFERVATQVRPFAVDTVPIPPVLKNVWRFQHWQRSWGNDQQFWGRVAQDRIRGKVAISWAYPSDGDWEIRGSAWLENVQKQPVWEMFGNVNIWNQALGVTGKLETFPSDQWRPWSVDSITAFLEGQ